MVYLVDWPPPSFIVMRLKMRSREVERVSNLLKANRYGISSCIHSYLLFVFCILETRSA